jgi:hypothetical protein
MMGLVLGALWTLVLSRRARQVRPATDVSTMTRDELIAWGAKRGMVVVDRAEHEAVCATIAELTVEQTDLDLEFRVLLGDA